MAVGFGRTTAVGIQAAVTDRPSTPAVSFHANPPIGSLKTVAKDWFDLDENERMYRHSLRHHPKQPLNAHPAMVHRRRSLGRRLPPLTPARPDLWIHRSKRSEQKRCLITPIDDDASVVRDQRIRGRLHADVLEFKNLTEGTPHGSTNKNEYGNLVSTESRYWLILLMGLDVQELYPACYGNENCLPRLG